MRDNLAQLLIDLSVLGLGPSPPTPPQGTMASCRQAGSRGASAGEGGSPALATVKELTLTGSVEPVLPIGAPSTITSPRPIIGGSETVGLRD